LNLAQLRLALRDREDDTRKFVMAREGMIPQEDFFNRQNLQRVLAKGSAAYMQGQWIVARELCESAERILRERGTGVAWQIDTAQFYTMLLLFYLGEIGELSRRLPAKRRPTSTSRSPVTCRSPTRPRSRSCAPIA